MNSNNNQVIYPFAEYPKAGHTIEVAPGVHWLSTPLPFRLRAINLYLLEDENGWTIVDCGYGRQEVREQWEQVWSNTIARSQVTRLIVTHFHPDHVGNAAWICERWNVCPWMTQAEWLTANLAILEQGFDDISHRWKFYASNGLDKSQLDVFRSGVVRYSAGVRLPESFHRLSEGQQVRIGGRIWKVIVGRGHSPEHASLYCDEIKVLIAGDQLLPEITTNVSVWPSEPEADSLRWFLHSLDRFAESLPADTLVLPSHRRPFRGARARIEQIKDHHRERLQRIVDLAANAPVTAGGLLAYLFGPGLDGHQIGFAMGEALAHLNYLVNTGALRRENNAGTVQFVHAQAPG